MIGRTRVCVSCRVPCLHALCEGCGTPWESHVCVVGAGTDQDRYDKLGAEEYYHCTPFFALSVALKEEQKRLEEMTKKLNDNVANMHKLHMRDKKKQAAKLSIASKWKTAVVTQKHEKKVNSLVQDIEKV